MERTCERVLLPSLNSQPSTINIRKLASVIGLAPIRPDLKGRLRELLCIHGPFAYNPEKWLPDLDSHQDKRLNRPPCYFDTTWQWRCRQDSHLHRSV